MHALVNSYGVWKKRLPLLWLQNITAKIFPPLTPVWGLVLVVTEQSLQESIPTPFQRASIFCRTKQDEKPTTHHRITVLGCPCRAWSLQQITVDERVGWWRGSGLLHPQPSQLVFNSHTTWVFRSVAQSLPQRSASFLFQNEWLYRSVGWTPAFLQQESKYLVPETCHLVCEDWE